MHDLKKQIEEILPQVRKPARYIGNEINSIKKNWKTTKLKILMAYPDLYEIGMSNLGIQILYHIFNSQNDALAERVFAPAPDLKEKLLEKAIPLFSLESWEPINNFDLIGFSLGHELTYTNILSMLKMGRIPIKRKERSNEDPFVFAGGPAVFNPIPLSDYFDFFVIGEAEEILNEIVDFFSENPKLSRSEKLKKLSEIAGIFVPEFKKTITKRYIKNLDKIPFPTKPIIPYIEVIHDRAMVEIMRGCKRRCRFCSAFSIYYPFRERSAQKVIDLASDIFKNTGYEEFSLVSLSSSDYSSIENVARELSEKLSQKKSSISLPSLRLDSFGIKLAKEICRVRPHSVTLAPEAGTEWLRTVIGKNLSDKEIFDGVDAAFSQGINNIKLYYMIGLPREREKDIQGIIDLSRKIYSIGRKYTKRANVTVSLSTFIPKPHTPFQWERQISIEETYKIQKFIKENLRDRGIELRWHSPETSFLEGVISRGDEDIGKVIEKAFELGSYLDAWSEYFKFDVWKKAFKECNIDPNSYLKERDINESLPWEIIAIGINKEYFLKEREKAYALQEN